MGKRKGTSTTIPLDIPGITLRKTRKYPDLLNAGRSRMQPGKHTSVELQHANRCNYTRSCSDGCQDSSDSELQSASSRSSSTQSTISSTIAKVNEQVRRNSTNDPAEIHIARQVSLQRVKPREVSLSAAFSGLSLSSAKARKSSSGSLQRPKHHPSLERIREEVSPSKIPKFSCSPTIRHAASTQALQSTPCRSPFKSTTSTSGGGLRTPGISVPCGRYNDEIPVFLTKEKLTSVPAWDTNGRLQDMEAMYIELRTQFASAAETKNSMEETLSAYKTQSMFSRAMSFAVHAADPFRQLRT